MNKIKNITFASNFKDLNVFNLKKSIFLIDENVYFTYPELFKLSQNIILPCTETNKTLKTVIEVYKKLSLMNVDRTFTIFAFGGGVLLDIAGFVSSTYLRGLKLISVPTTLLAQADAAIGGKNAVNLTLKSALIKNQIGTIKNAHEIIVCTQFNKTLKTNEIKNGIIEILKHGLIGSPELFFEIINNMTKFNNIKFLENIIKKSISIKNEIVKKDLYEKNIRRKLNLGHTFAHTFESIYGLKHGSAVLLGLKYTLAISFYYLYINKKEYELINLALNKFITKDELKILNNINKEEVFALIKKDKKIIDQRIKFVFIKKIGVVFVKKIKLLDLYNLIDKLIL